MRQNNRILRTLAIEHTTRAHLEQAAALVHETHPLTIVVSHSGCSVWQAMRSPPTSTLPIASGSRPAVAYLRADRCSLTRQEIETVGWVRTSGSQIRAHGTPLDERACELVVRL